MNDYILHNAIQGGYKLDQRFNEVDKTIMPHRGNIHLFIMRDQLIYDIDAQATIVARSRKKNDIDQNILTDTEQFNSMFNRWIDKYVSLTKGRLAAYVLPDENISQINKIKENNLIDISLSMPEEWNDVMFPNLELAVHDYITNGVLYEYFSLTLTPNDTVTMSRKANMELAYGDIKRYADTPRAGMVHKKMSPFHY